MALFVLVHGAFHDGAAFASVIQYLQSHGHTASAPTLAGHGREASKQVTHDDCVRSLVDHVTACDLHEIVLVGHSFAGTVIARAAPLIADRVRRLVFWNAFVLEDGGPLVLHMHGIGGVGKSWLLDAFAAHAARRGAAVVRLDGRSAARLAPTSRPTAQLDVPELDEGDDRQDRVHRLV